MDILNINKGCVSNSVYNQSPTQGMYPPFSVGQKIDDTFTKSVHTDHSLNTYARHKPVQKCRFMTLYMYMSVYESFLFFPSVETLQSKNMLLITRSVNARVSTLPDIHTHVDDIYKFFRALGGKATCTFAIWGLCQTCNLYIVHVYSMGTVLMRLFLQRLLQVIRKCARRSV